MTFQLLRTEAIGALIVAFGLTASEARAQRSDLPATFVPPPRSIADITAILDQQKPDKARIAALTNAASAPAPTGADDKHLEDFYVARNHVATQLGRATQALADAGQALDIATRRRQQAGPQDYPQRLGDMVRAEMSAGRPSEVIRYSQEQIAATGITLSGVQPIQFFVRQSAQDGDFKTAQSWLDKLDGVIKQMPSLPAPVQRGIAPFKNFFQAEDDLAHADYLDSQGKLAEEEPYLRRASNEFRQAETEAAQQPFPGPGVYLNAANTLLGKLGFILAKEGRPVEGEIAARQALLGELSLHGKYSTETTLVVTQLAGVLELEGRYKEAEALYRTALDVDTTLGVDDSSQTLNVTRFGLATTLVAQGEFAPALAFFEQARRALAGDPTTLAAIFSRTADYAMAALNQNHKEDALHIASDLVDRRTRMMGSDTRLTLEALGVYAAAQAATGDITGARASFARAVPALLNIGAVSAGEPNATAQYDYHLKFIVESYLSLLAKGDRSDIAQAFRVADAVRGRAVQQSVAAAMTRSRIDDAALAERVRRDQDAALEIEALEIIVADGLALPPEERDQSGLDQARSEIDRVQKDRAQLDNDIARTFPEYPKLLNPQPSTVDDTRGALSAGEALLSIYVARDRVYLWAVPKQGPVAFAVSPLSPSDVDKAVATLRKALDPDAATAGEIPAFDVATAYKLYAGLLDPVSAGWQGAGNLLVVANGSLAQLPFGLLATQNAKPTPDQNGQPLFSGYKALPWLIRQVAITQLPSVTSLTALRTSRAAKGDRKPFIGFGDPWFSKKEEAEAIAQQGLQLALQVMGGGLVAMRKAPVHLRSAPKVEGVNVAELGELPRLPDTADEVKEAAEALKADPAKDVYLGAQANEQIVRSVDLNDRRVVMFATHGLVPDDLDGLTEPALALSAPDVAKVPGNGLLTVSKILGLRLNADWVVLSACNTAAGGGAGAEAISGLGLAFFYAGSRALLVSNWPVETRSARLLTTGIFQREVATPGITRAEALRQSMLALIDGPGMIDPQTQKPVYSYAHPIFWAPFSLVGDGGAG